MFSLIVAYCRNRGIGLDNKMPWPRLKKDLENFYNITTEVHGKNKLNAIIMGRKTWESIGSKPLKERVNIIISKTLQPSTDQKDLVKIFSSIDEALEFCKKNKGIESTFVIGGESIY